MVVVAVSSMAPISAHLSDDYSLYSVYNYMSVNNSMGIFPAFPVNSVPEHRDVCDTERANADLVSGLVDHDKGGGNLKESSSNSHQANAAIRHSNGSSPSGNLEKKRRIYQNYEAADDNCDLKTCDKKPSPAKAAKINHRRTSTRDQQKSYRKTDEECDNKIRKVDSPEGLIFVRAKRGQATDRHSLAERGRRQKINERMRLLQRLVPGCYKVTAKAVILDEIINYVKSLQNQVDFLSMKLSAASLPYDFSLQMENHMFKDQLGVDLQQIIPAFQADVPMTDCQVALDNYDYIAGRAQTGQDMATVSTPAYDALLTSMTWSTSVNENALGCMGTNQWNADLQCLVEGEFPEQLSPLNDQHIIYLEASASVPHVPNNPRMRR